MNPLLISIASMFARPVGNLINTGIKAGSAAVIAWGVSKGWDVTSLSMIVSEVALAISTVISAVAATQGVTIPVINEDENNGVRVVSAVDARAARLPKQNAPLPH